MNTTPFLPTAESFKTFFNRAEKDFYVLQIGYHDFTYIPPLKFRRKQRFFTFHLVISGRGTLEYGEKTYELSKSDVFVLPPETFFAYYPDQNEPWEYVFFEIEGDLAENYFSTAGFSKENPIGTCGDLPRALSALAPFFERLRNGLPTSYFEVLSLFFSLLHSTLDKDSAGLGLDERDLVEEAKSVIRLKFFDPDLTVEQVAASLHFSHSRLCRLFKNKTGKTMIAYINDLRMNYAEELLRTTSLKATEIAYMSGFNEYTYFLMRFKRKNHLTTSEYRALHRK